jgi:formamidopyrimidine-DNA glycosylase
MPELPEVETVCRGLSAAVAGRRIAGALARRPDLRIPLPPDLAARLTGRRVERIDRRAKYILIHLDDGAVVIAHLGMSGRMAIMNGNAPPPEPHDHVELAFEGGVTVRFNDARRFGLLTLSDEAGLASHPLLAGIGPEPLSDEFDGPYLARVLNGRIPTIKAALLDQRIVAGVGNIYACEALFRAGISPKRKAGSVKGARAAALAAAVKAVLEDAIASGGSSLRDYVQPSGELGYFQHRWAVYGHEGLACPGCDCDVAATGGIRRIVQAARSTFYCPRRQR